MNRHSTAYPERWFDPGCTRCPRLAGFLAELRLSHPHYYALPVGPFGPASAPLLIVGLAPGMHGANRTGRPFTGDHAGILLYESLHRLGLATRPVSVARNDGLELKGCRISNAVKCVPPGNKPTPAEVRTCRAWLAAELAEARPRVVLALGRIAHETVLAALGMSRAAHRFAHGAEHDLGEAPLLIDSYHCSRYNTQTKRLTAEMFMEVLSRAAKRAATGAFA
jgi:uracil-DNA glycosylase